MTDPARETTGATASGPEPGAATGATAARPPRGRRRRFSENLKESLARPFRRRTLTWRLLAVLVVLLLLALTLSNVATGLLMRRYLTERAVQELTVAAVPVANRVLGQYRNQSALDIPSSYAVVFMDSTGHIVGRVYPSDARYRPDIPTLLPDDPRVTGGHTFVVRSRGGGPDWLVLAGPMQDSGTYAVATSLGGVDQTVNRMMAISAVIGFFVIGTCLIVGWLGFRRAFRPLRTIEDTAAAIAAGDLTRRIPARQANDEVASLSRSLNAMLAQIETSFAVREASEERMHRFVADASHELRTPLATVRGYAELYRQGAAGSPEATAEAMRRIEQEATRMSGLVEDLLTLARMDDRRPMELSSVDLTVIAADAVQDARAREGDRSIRLLGLDGGPIEPTVLSGDEARLRQVVTNLVANALAHTPPGTPVEVLVGPRADHLRIEVRDHGPGIAPEEMARVFERFYRHDPARGRRDIGGHGLGLAIVAAIVEGHGGRVGVARTDGGGATFIVDLPRAPTAGAFRPPAQP